MKINNDKIILHGNFCTGCMYSWRHSTATPQVTIKKYQRLVLEIKPDFISNLFTTDAEIAHGNQRPVSGRDSILMLFLVRNKH